MQLHPVHLFCHETGKQLHICHKRQVFNSRNFHIGAPMFCKVRDSDRMTSKLGKTYTAHPLLGVYKTQVTGPKVSTTQRQQQFATTSPSNTTIDMSSVFFYEPFYDFDRFFDDINRQGSATGQEIQRRRNVEGGGAVRAFKPRYVSLTNWRVLDLVLTETWIRMDLHEDSEKNLVTATFEFPGVSKENIQIDVHNNRLTVSAETKESTDHDERGYAVRERRYGKFSRTLQLPQGVKVWSIMIKSIQFDNNLSTGRGNQGIDGEWYLECHVPEDYPGTCS